MNKYWMKIIKICPLLTLLFSLSTVVVTTTINNSEISLIYIYFCTQVYLNWFSIVRISCAAAAIDIGNEEFLSSAKKNPYNVRISMNNSSSLKDNDKLWYCDKCAMYTSRPSRHCALCKKCFHHRDHHCFFIGGCILRQNMGNFILICIYTSVVSIYSLTIISRYLYNHLDHFLADNATAFNILLNFSFPVALARSFYSAQESCILLVTLFNALFSISCICSVYGLWKLYACLTGRQRYFPYTPKKNDIIEIFGSYGLWNFIFPINGLIADKSLPQQSYMLKEI